MEGSMSEVPLSLLAPVGSTWRHRASEVIRHVVGHPFAQGQHFVQLAGDGLLHGEETLRRNYERFGCETEDVASIKYAAGALGRAADLAAEALRVLERVPDMDSVAHADRVKCIGDIERSARLQASICDQDAQSRQAAYRRIEDAIASLPDVPMPVGDQ